MLKRIKNRRYDSIHSLGEACFCATSLLSNGLRVMSGPFDWCWGGTFSQRVDMVMNEFSSFIDKEDLDYIGKREDPEPCRIYKNRRNDIVFNHDFPLDKSFEQSYDAVHEKYKRRTKRFIQTIKESSNILLVYMELPETENGETSDDRIIDAAQKLNNKFPNTNIEILYVRHNDQFSDGDVSYNLDQENVIFADVYIAKRNNKNNHAVNKKNLSKILSFIKRDGKNLFLLKRKTMRFSGRNNEFLYILGIKIKIR